MKAFPLKAVNKFDDSEGMDLRDYFAAMAMQADLTNYDGADWRRVAVQAYQMADAMMKAREQ
jgi:hypothetical protein